MTTFFIFVTVLVVIVLGCRIEDLHRKLDKLLDRSSEEKKG